MLNQEIANRLNKMERTYFFERMTGEASGSGYIASNTWRGWRASPRIDGAVKDALVAAFDFLIDRFERFLRSAIPLNRSLFDKFHEGEIDALYQFERSYHQEIIIHPDAVGDFKGYAYNSYAKIINLAHTHWCFRPQPFSKKIKYNPIDSHELRHSLHVPLDTKVFAGINNLRSTGLLIKSSVRIPKGGMGAVKSKEHYCQIQNYLRSVADQVPSANFNGNTVSPLAFEALWGT